MSGRKSQTHPLRHGYERLLLCWWLIAILALAFCWWKSIWAIGAFRAWTPLFSIAGGITGGSAYLGVNPDEPSAWKGVTYYYSIEGEERLAILEQIGTYEYFGKFDYGSEALPGTFSEVGICVPFWFLMLVVSLLFWELHFFMKRRIRRILGKFPDPSQLSDAAESK